MDVPTAGVQSAEMVGTWMISFYASVYVYMYMEA